MMKATSTIHLAISVPLLLIITRSLASIFTNSYYNNNQYIYGLDIAVY